MKWQIDRAIFRDDTGLNIRGAVMNSIDAVKHDVGLEFHEKGLLVTGKQKNNHPAFGAIVADSSVKLWYLTPVEEPATESKPLKAVKK